MCILMKQETVRGSKSAGHVPVDSRPLWSNSNDMRMLLVPQAHNNLPPGLRRPGLTVDSFRQSLKTHLFVDRSA